MEIHQKGKTLHKHLHNTVQYVHFLVGQKRKEKHSSEAKKGTLPVQNENSGSA